MSKPEGSFAGYVLTTAAHNEEAFLEKTIQSIAGQTTLPKRWVIVSDGSSDGTDQIVAQNARRLPFLQFIRVDRDHSRNFVSKVNALRVAYAALRSVNHDYVGNLDADVSLEPDYYGRLLGEFERNPRLGLAGGFVYEEKNGTFQSRPGNTVESVAHAGQLVRRECYEEIGGYLPLPYGGEDWCAETTARMKGWQTRAFSDLRIMHHRPTGGASGTWRRNFRRGRADFSLGSHPLIELYKCARVAYDRPYLAGSVARLAGFIWSYCCGEQRLVSGEFVRFIRGKQKKKFWETFERFQKKSADEPVTPIRDPLDKFRAG